MYKFKDERINFCFNTYAQTTLGLDALKRLFKLLPKEVFESIDKCQNSVIKKGNTKVGLQFYLNNFSKSFDAFQMTVQHGKDIVSMKLFYANFDSSIEESRDICKTILFIEHKKQKNIFSAPKRIYSQYAFFNKEHSRYNVSFIEDVNSKMSKHCTIINDLSMEIRKLKSKRQYQMQDAKTIELNRA